MARDAAFHFYYQALFDALAAAGCETVFFSPLTDRRLPAGISGLYLGGGYPEAHAEALAANGEMLAAIRAYAASGKPLYAECGGLMYLSEGLTADGRFHPFLGILPARTRMLAGKKTLGYVEVTLTAGFPLGRPRGGFPGARVPLLGAGRRPCRRSSLAAGLRAPAAPLGNGRGRRVPEGGDPGLLHAPLPRGAPGGDRPFHQPIGRHTMNETPPRPLMRAFLDAPLSGPEIEARSMEIIDSEAPAHPFGPGEWRIVRRMIHTVGDFGIIEAVRFSPDAVEAGVKALKGCRSIFTDSNMIRTGISLARLRGVCGFYRSESIRCHVADKDIARLARRSGLAPVAPRRPEGKAAPGRGDRPDRQRPGCAHGDQPDDHRGGASALPRRRAPGRLRPRRGEQGGADVARGPLHRDGGPPRGKPACGERPPRPLRPGGGGGRRDKALMDKMQEIRSGVNA